MVKKTAKPKPKSASPWIAHVKKVMKAEGISFKQALSVAGKTWKK